MKQRFVLSVIAMLFLVVAHANAQSLKKNLAYFDQPSKVGLIISTDLGYDEGLSLLATLLAAALDPNPDWGIYDSAFRALEPIINPAHEFIKFYSDILTGKGKEIVLIDSSITKKGFPDFNGFKVSGYRYYRKDLKVFYEKYHVNEILIARVAYGTHSQRSYGVETYVEGVCVIYTALVDARTNAIVYKEKNFSRERVHGDWNIPPDYDKLKNSILKAIAKAKAKEMNSYNPAAHP